MLEEAIKNTHKNNELISRFKMLKKFPRLKRFMAVF